MRGLEKVVVTIGGLVGLGAGVLFHYTVQQLRLPALLYGIVDLFGVMTGSVVVGLLAALIAIGAMVILIDWIFPSQPDIDDI